MCIRDRKVADAEVIFTGMGFAPLLRELWSDATRVQWVHSFSAGLDNVLFPELIESTAVMTNARGVFARSLGEFVIASVLFFAKELRRMIRQQREGVWEPFDVEEVHGQTMGIVGYGEIGRAAAERAHALGMKTIALRRRPELPVMIRWWTAPSGRTGCSTCFERPTTWWFRPRSLPPPAG